MPKEVIKSTLPHDHEGWETQVELRWGRDTDVQIGTTAGGELAFSVLQQALEELKDDWPELKTMVISELAEAIVQKAQTHQGWWVDLTRVQINTLIRYLRRGRDQAYGADA